MTFRDREKERQSNIKKQLFSTKACNDGLFMKKRRDFCLHENCRSENLFEEIREDAIEYFIKRKIPWHQGKGGMPSNHLCCSQSCCVNFIFPYMKYPDYLKTLLISLGYSVKQILSFCLDVLPGDNHDHFICFEWIGAKNYLQEWKVNRPAKDDERSRGSNFTSADFAIRFLQDDGKIRIILGEWKYTEYYQKKCIRWSEKGTDRLSIYQALLDSSQIQMGDLSFESLFYDPFDQLMRLQLLASEMERAHEMEADIVSVIHIAPKSNRELMNKITSPELRHLGESIHEVWDKLTQEDKFKGIYLEDLLFHVSDNSPQEDWKSYITLRYGHME